MVQDQRRRIDPAPFVRPASAPSWPSLPRSRISAEATSFQCAGTDRKGKTSTVSRGTSIMLSGLRLHYVDPIRSFGRPARLFLTMLLVDGVIFSAWQLFFNFYILQSGFTREFLGLANSMPSAAGLIFGIPLGRLSDRIGRKASIIIGIALSSIMMLAQITFRDPRLIAGAAFVYGAANMLFIVSQAPLMAQLSNRENRTLLFSLSWGLQTIASAVGALFAGQLPGLFGGLLHVAAHSATAYQAVLITGVLTGNVRDRPDVAHGRAAACVGTAPRTARGGARCPCRQRPA